MEQTTEVRRGRLPWVLQEPRVRGVLLIALLAGIVDGMVIPFLAISAANRGISLAAIGAMSAAFLLAQVALQLPLGILSDRIGRAWVIALGLLLLSGATLGFATADSVPTFIVLRILQGFGVAALLPSMRALIADLTPMAQRGMAYAGFNAAFFGGIFGGPILGGWIIRLTDDRSLYVVTALLGVTVAIATPLAFPAFRRPVDQNPSPLDAAEVATEVLERVKVPYRLLFSRALIGAFILAAASQAPAGLSTSIWGIYVDYLGATEIQVGLTYSAFAVALLVLAPLGGRVASLRRRWPVLLVTHLAIGAVLAGYGMTSSIGVILLLGVGEGMLSAFALPTLDAYVSSVADRRVMGRVYGAFATAGTLGAAIMSWVSALLYAVEPRLPFFVIGGVVMVMTLPAIGLIRSGDDGT